MPTTVNRARTRFKVMVRTVVARGDMHEVTFTGVGTDDADVEKSDRELDSFPDEDDMPFSTYVTRSPVVELTIRTVEKNRWVVGEVFYLDLKPTR